MFFKKISLLVLLFLCMQMNSFAQTKVVCVGNSITEGYGLSNGQKPWPAQLGDLLGGGYNVINRGRSGFAMLKSAKWDNGSTRSYWDTDTYQYAKNDKPDILIMALGTNDAGSDVWTNAQSFKSDYIDMINEFKAINNKVKIYVCLPPYIYNTGQNNTLEQYVIPAIQQVANATGATLINLHDITANRRNDYNDDLHPNVNGAALLARTIYNSITKTSTNIIPYAQDKYGWRQTSELSITQGEKFALGPQSTVNGNTWQWTGPNGFTSNNREFTIENATTAQDGAYTVTFTANNGQKSSAVINVHVWSWAAPVITPYVLGANGWQQVANLTVARGSNFSIGPQEANGYGDKGTWMWTGPNNFTSNNREITITNASAAQAGTYQVTFSDEFGRRAIMDFQITVDNNSTVTPVNPGNGPAITPYVKNAYGNWYRDDVIQLRSGDSFSFGPQIDGSNNWAWTGPNGFTSNQREFTINNVNVNNAGTYNVTHTNQAGQVSTHTFTVYVDGRASANATLPTYPANNIADASYNAFMDAFLMTDNKGLTFFREGYKGTAADYRLYCWDQGLVIQMVEDRIRFRGDDALKPLLTRLIDAFSVNEDANDLKNEGVVSRSIHEKYHQLAQNDINISDWTWNAFSDDLLWMSLPYIRAYQITNEKRFLDQAEWTWEYLVERAWDNYLGGGFWWNWDDLAKSGLSNNPAICLSAYLYQATGKQKYLDKAIETYNWVYSVLRNNDGSVDENINIENAERTPRRANGYNAYNQGTFIEGATALYTITGDEKYLNAAIQTLNWVMTNDVNNDGIITRYKTDGTYQSEFARGVAFLMEAKPSLWNTTTTYGRNHVATTYYNWLRKNADAAWNTRDRNYNLNGCQWDRNMTFDPNSELAKKHTEVFVSSVVMTQVVPQGNAGNPTTGQAVITPYVHDKYGWRQQNTLSVTIGEQFAIGPQANTDGTWYWNGPNGFTSNNREITFNDITTAQDGTYTVTFTANNGSRTTSQIAIHVYTWDAPAITPYVLDQQGWRQDQNLNIGNGIRWAIGPQEAKGYDDGNGTWAWTGPNGFTSNNREINFQNAATNQAGTYTVTFTDQYGRRAMQDFAVFINGVANANSNLLSGDDVVNGINEIKTNGKTAEIYDLQGRKVTSPKAGQLYIVNGRKVVIRK